MAPLDFCDLPSILQAVKIASCKQHASAHNCIKELEDDTRGLHDSANLPACL